jgi:hypothetical protein
VRPERLGRGGFFAMAFMMDRFGIVYNRFLLRPLPLNSHENSTSDRIFFVGGLLGDLGTC